MASGDRGDVNVRRRSQRLIDMKEAGTSEEERILKLKRDWYALIDRRDTKLLKPAKSVGAPPEFFEPLLVDPAAKKRKVVKTKLPQGLIDYYILNPRKAYHDIPEEKLRKYSPEFRQDYFQQRAITDKMMEYRRALIKQFRDKGFAYDYKEVFTDDDEDKWYDVQGCVEGQRQKRTKKDEDI